MYQSVNVYDFRDAFIRANRKEKFTYEGARVLFAYLEDYEDNTGTMLELDVIALCCDYVEDTYQEIADNYDIDLSDCDPGDNDAIKAKVLEYLSDHTIVCGDTDTTVVYAQF